jgi:hypothetical protein
VLFYSSWFLGTYFWRETVKVVCGLNWGEGYNIIIDSKTE